MCLGVNHIFTNGGEDKGWIPMIPKCIATLGITFVKDLWMFRALVGKVKNTKLGPHDTIRKALKLRCLKCPRIVHLYLIRMSYDQMKGWESNWEFDSWPQIPWKQRSNEVRLECAITDGKIFLKAIKYCLCTFKIDFIWKRYEYPKFWDNNSLNDALPSP